jgi:hypothetical protein
MRIHCGSGSKTMISVLVFGQHFRDYHILVPALYSIWVLFGNLAARRIRLEVIQEFLSTDMVTLSDPSHRGKYRPCFMGKNTKGGREKKIICGKKSGKI